MISLFYLLRLVYDIFFMFTAPSFSVREVQSAFLSGGSVMVYDCEDGSDEPSDCGRSIIEIGMLHAVKGFCCRGL